MMAIEVPGQVSPESLRTMLGAAAVDMSLGEFRALTQGLPDELWLYFDRLPQDAVFREFPADRAVGRFIAVVTDRRPEPVTPIGMIDRFKDLDRIGRGVGYGASPSDAITAAIADYRSRDEAVRK